MQNPHAPLPKPTPLQLFIWAVVSCAGGSLLAVLVIGRGITLSQDAVAYLSLAQSLAESGSYTDYAGYATTFWPPVVPALYAVMFLIGITDIATSAGIMNGLSLAIAVFFGAWFVWYATRSRAVSVIAAIALLLGAAPFIWTGVYILSEPVFIAITMLLLFTSYRYYAEASNTTLYTFAILVGLATLTRYAGLVYVPLGAVLIYFGACRSGVKPIPALMRFVPVAVLPICIWALRNFLEDGTLLGPRCGTAADFTANIEAFFHVLGSWYLPDRMNDSLLLAVICCAAVLAGGIWLLKTKERRVGLSMVLIYLIVYASGMLFVSTFSHIEPLNGRLLSPLAMPIMLYLVVVFHEVAQRKGKQRWIALVLIAVAACGFVYKQTVNLAAFTGYRPAGAASVMWDDRPEMEEIIVLSVKEEVYLLTNAPDLLYYRTGEQQIWSLFTQESRGCTPVKLKDQFASIEEQFTAGREVVLVWFPGFDREYLLEPEEYAQYYKLVPQQNGTGAAKYLLRQKR